MEYTASETKKYKQVPVGTHTGICYMIVDIGTQEVDFEGTTSQKRQVIIGWETPDELTDATPEYPAKPLSVMKTYTLTFGKKAALLKDYAAWTKEPEPKKFVLDKLLGTGCNLAVGATSGGNAKVVGVTALKATEKVPPLSRGTILYDLRKPDELEYVKLPEFIKEKIAASPEYRQWCVTGSTDKPKQEVPADLNDEIPY